jgi:DnaJ-class molecular chaperone
MEKILNPEKYGMLICPVCFGKGFINEPKRQACPKCGGFGWIKKEE